MKWFDLKDKKPVVGQYVFVKRDGSRSVAIWDDKEAFVFLMNEIISDEKKWAPAFLKGKYVHSSNGRGELDFVPSGIFDEDGNEWLSQF